MHAEQVIYKHRHSKPGPMESVGKQCMQTQQGCGLLLQMYA
jgi:hypothetical protein